MKKLTSVILLVVVLTGCDKPGGAADATPVTKPAETQRDEKIATLTRENLLHVVLKTEPAQLSPLGMTLRAASS